MENISAIPNILHSFKEEQKKKKVTNFDTNEHRACEQSVFAQRKERKGYLVIGPICEVGRSHFQFWFDRESVRETRKRVILKSLLCV